MKENNYPIEIEIDDTLTDSFKDYAVQVRKNAKALSAKLTEYDFNIVSGGTDNHLMLIDLSNKNDAKLIAIIGDPVVKNGIFKGLKYPSFDS